LSLVDQVVLARTEGGAVCGGYNPKGWIGLGEDRDAIAAFLFTWPDGNTSRRPIKLQKARRLRFSLMSCCVCSQTCSTASQTCVASGSFSDRADWLEHF
jgi:hypothetical protein